MDIIYFITHKLLYSRTETWQILRQIFLFIFWVEGDFITDSSYLTLNSQSAVTLTQRKGKKKKNPIFQPKILTIKLCFQMVKVEFDTESACFLRNFFLPNHDHSSNPDTNYYHSH